MRGELRDTDRATDVAPRTTREIRVMAFNAAKLFFHAGGVSFAPADEIRKRLERVAAVLESERIDLAFLSEVVTECGPVPQNQVADLARRAHFPEWASGDNYSFGVPFFRIRSGNAVLSRFPLRALDVQQLPGAKTLWSPSNDRRTPWVELRVHDEWLLAASVRNDSFDSANNLLQSRVLLERVGDRPALLAGDFNAEPSSESMRAFVASDRFTPVVDGAATYPADAPR